MLVNENLKKLNLEIPKAPDPVGAYLAYKKTANLYIYPVKYQLMLVEKLQKENWEKNYL